MSFTDLCSHAHAARNVHTENHQRVLQVLVVVLAPVRQVEVVAAYACTLTVPRVDHTVVDGVFTPAELAKPHLKEEFLSLICVPGTSESVDTYASLYRAQRAQRCSTFHTNDWLLEKLHTSFWKNNNTWITHGKKRKESRSFYNNGVWPSLRSTNLSKLKDTTLKLALHPLSTSSLSTEKTNKQKGEKDQWKLKFKELKQVMKKTYVWVEQEEEEGRTDGLWKPWRREEVEEEEKSVEAS